MFAPAKFLLIGIMLLMIPSSVFAQKEQIAFNALVNFKGAALEDGTGITIVQAEAPDVDGDYQANTADGQFTGKTFTSGSGATGVSSHANTVSRFLFGNTISMSGGVTDITTYDANDYLNNQLGATSGADPVAQGFDIGNHSYVGRASGTFTAADAEDMLERFDFTINRDNTLMVVGTDNRSNSLTPRVLAPSYNAITVGLSNGDHARTMTPNYGPARFATELVVPVVTVTSNATPVVGSVAALLKEAGAGTNFVQNEVLRSTLFAGATKWEFADWDQTATRRIDEVYGFGELNVFNSYRIFEGGEFEGSITADPATDIGAYGWDYGDFNGTDELHYDFSVQPSALGTELSAVLTWNMDITDNNPTPLIFDASRSLADLNLELFDSTGTYMGSILDQSFSTDYNHEHIYIDNLAAGDYTFRISGDQATDFGFSWRVVAVPEPSSSALIACSILGAGLCRRRKSTKQASNRESI